ncbi:unnamed protein product [Linum trigynum]|uniref:Uncharacterized protein n=1 Tax=Linum trigynum TaxID=586398 RepID=A0AAV2CDL2_9ROSI
MRPPKSLQPISSSPQHRIRPNDTPTPRTQSPTPAVPPLPFPTSAHDGRFEVDEFDPRLIELRCLKGGAEETEKKNEPKFSYIPCLDNFEIHCPDSALDCIVHMPNGY